MRQGGLILFCVALVPGATACKQRHYSEVNVAAAPRPGQCPIPDPLAIPGVNTKTGKCVDLTEFRVANHLEGNREGGYLATTESYNDFATPRGFKTNVANFPSYPMVANVKHDGKFWIAQLDLGHVSATYFQVEEFNITLPKEKLESDPALRQLFNQTLAAIEVKMSDLQPPQLKADAQAAVNNVRTTGRYTAAHGQFRIDFAQPIPLALQTDPSVRTTVKSVVLSVHAVAENYDPVAGLKGEYPLALGLYSAQEKFTGSVLRSKNNFRQYRLNFASDDLIQFVNHYLKNASATFRTRDYNTFDANCGNLLFETAENAFFLKKRPDVMAQAKQNRAAMFGRGYPKYAQYALQAYGWLANPQMMQGEAWTEMPE
jgi:hypothetical protein